MPIIAELLAGRPRRADTMARPGDARPSRLLAIVTCMDTRLDPFAILGLSLGEAQILRNAGGRVTEDVLRSLAICVNSFGVETVIVMHHTGCGLVGTTQEELRKQTGADFDFRTIQQHDAALEEDIKVLIEAPYLKGMKESAGLLYDLDSGEITVLA